MDKFKLFFKDNFPGVAVLIAGAMIAGAVLYKDSANRPPAALEGQASAQVIELGNLPALGNPKAKVTVVEFGDYQCPFCGRFYQTTEQKLREEYVKVGKIRFAWRDFAFLGEESIWAAEAARCANDQGKFWGYHDLLFERQSGENEGAFVKNTLKRFARELKLNGEAFDQCLDSEKHRQAVVNDTKQGSDYGTGGTPTTFVNGQKIVGAVPYEQFKQVIDSLLKQK